jgi:hypothetical protein
MGYGFAMRIKLLFVAAPGLRADVLGVQNAGSLVCGSVYSWFLAFSKRGWR